MDVPVSNSIQKILAVAALLIVALAWYPPLQSLADSQVDDGLKRALISFASARTLNAVISVIQGTELSVQPLGMGVTLTLGQVLDPINDLVEQFSTLMLYASVAFGIQKALLAIGANWVISLAMSVIAIVWAFLRVRRQTPPWLTRVLIVLMLVRFAIPVVTLGSDLVYQEMLAADYQEQIRSIDAVAGELAKAEPSLANGTLGAAPAASERSTPRAQPGASAASSPAQPGTWFGRLKDRITPGASGADASATVEPESPTTDRSGWWGSLKEKFGQSLPRIDLNYESIKTSAEQLPERIIKVIVIFLLQTMIVPLVLLWILYRVAIGLMRPGLTRS